MIAAGAPLQKSLDELTLFVEDQEKDARCGILVLDHRRKHFRRGGGASLPESYHKALDFISIHPPYFDACGEAAHLAMPVIVPDIAEETRWPEEWKALVLSCGLRALQAIPVIDAGGCVVGLFALFYTSPRNPQPVNAAIINLAISIAAIAIERNAMENKPRESELRYRQILEAMSVPVYTTDAKGRITLFNKAAADLWGREPETAEDRWCGALEVFTPDGAPWERHNLPIAVAVRDNQALTGVEAVVQRLDGSRVNLLAYPRPLLNISGEVVGGVNVLVDISQQKQAEAQLRLFMTELNHRVKNLLAIVQGVASQTARFTPEPKSFINAFSARLIALAKTQDLLMANAMDSSSLKAIAVTSLEPFHIGKSAAIRISGPEVFVQPDKAMYLSLVLHELATNAVKYGALAKVSGYVEMNWSIKPNDPPMIEIVWAEHDGPPVTAPGGAGFGATMFAAAAAYLGGTIQTDFAKDGVQCLISFPAGQ